MTRIRYALTAAVIAAVVLPCAVAEAQTPSITIRAARVLDGRGGMLANATVEVKDGVIVTVDRRTGPVTHDLGNRTLMPGLIDVHVHIGNHFGKDGRAQNQGDGPPGEKPDCYEGQ